VAQICTNTLLTRLTTNNNNLLNLEKNINQSIDLFQFRQHGPYSETTDRQKHKHDRMTDRNTSNVVQRQL